jgi:hypothetical protein
VFPGWRQQSPPFKGYSIKFRRFRLIEIIISKKNFFSPFQMKKGCVNRLYITCVAKLEQRALKDVNNDLNTNIYSYLETSGGQSSYTNLNVVHFYNTSVN